MDELKKAKRVVQYGVFAAYHLALETSFLADERASLPELPLNSPITVAIPVKSSVVERSISMVPDFSLPGYQGQQPSLPIDEPQRSKSLPSSDLILSSNSTVPFVENGPSSQLSQPNSSTANSAAIFSSHSVSWTIGSESYGDEPSPYSTIKERNELGTQGEMEESPANGYQQHQELESGKFSIDSEDVHNSVVSSQPTGSESLNAQQNNQNHQEFGAFKEELGTGKDDFPTASSAHQSILVSLSSRCILKGSVCERSHLFRIKYYGTFDKPLGRFLRDKLFNQVSCLILMYIRFLSIDNLEVLDENDESLYHFRLTDAILATCQQKHMFIVILIDRAPSQYLLKSYQKFSCQVKGKGRSGCGIDACDAHESMVFPQLLEE